MNSLDDIEGRHYDRRESARKAVELFSRKVSQDGGSLRRSLKASPQHSNLTHTSHQEAGVIVNEIKQSRISYEKKHRHQTVRFETDK